jgi:hypothetical protein
MMMEKRPALDLIRIGYRRSRKACQPFDHDIADDAALTAKRSHPPGAR